MSEPTSPTRDRTVAGERSRTGEDQPLVRALNVLKSFHGNEVLKGIDLDVHRGEVVCLLGPSGSGKTTFLRCINQLETIDGGRIWVDGDLVGFREEGEHLHHLTDKQVATQRREIGMVFQRFNLFPHMTALENVMEAPIQVRVDGEGPQVVLEVANQGNPIPPELLPRIFEPFTRASEGGNSLKGVGLGLFIVHEIVAAHGGHIDVRSSAGTGTVFRVRLPRALVA